MTRETVSPSSTPVVATVTVPSASSSVAFRLVPQLRLTAPMVGTAVSTVRVMAVDTALLPATSVTTAVIGFSPSAPKLVLATVMVTLPLARLLLVTSTSLPKLSLPFFSWILSPITMPVAETSKLMLVSVLLRYASSPVLIVMLRLEGAVVSTVIVLVEAAETLPYASTK